MVAIFGILAVLSFIGLVVGLISPKRVLYWGKPEKRTRGKALWQYGLAVIVSFILVAAFAPDSSQDADTSAAEVESPSSSDKTAPAAQQQQNSPLISKNEYDSVKEGMTYDQVVGIVGGEGEKLLEDGDMILYEFKAEEDLGGVDAQVDFVFQNGKLSEKRNRNHDDASPSNSPFVDQDELDQLQEGMTYQQTVDLIGVEGTKQSEQGDSVTYVFPADASIGGGEVRILFDGGKLSIVTHFTEDEL